MLRRILIGAGIGIAIGAVIGTVGRCSTGTCPFTSNPYTAAITGGLIGLVFAALGGTAGD